MSTPPGWYDDPSAPGSGTQRYWDGQQWTQSTQPGAAAQPAAPQAQPGGYAPGYAAAPQKKGGAGRVVAIVLAALAALVGALIVIGLVAGDDEGGGGGGGKFNDAQFGITFDYPDYLEEREDVTISQTGGSRAVATKAFALDKTNLVLLQRYDLGQKVSDDNIDAVKSQLEPIVEQIAGRDLTASDVEHGGLPGFRYEDVKVQTPPSTSRLVFLFDGDREYQFACQYEDQNRDRILEACDEMLSSLSKK